MSVVHLRDEWRRHCAQQRGIVEIKAQLGADSEAVDAGVDHQVVAARPDDCMAIA